MPDALPAVEYSRYGVSWEQATPDSKRVLVVVNMDSPISRKVAEYYCTKRRIPKENTVVIRVGGDKEAVAELTYEQRILAPVKAAVKAAKSPIDFIVTTKGVPIRIGDATGYSVDSCLLAMDRNVTPAPAAAPPKEKEEQFRKAIAQNINPYGGRAEPFSSKKFGIYLVCRLDGYDWADIKGLIDNSLAAKPMKGLFYFNTAANRTAPGYVEKQQTLERAHTYMRRKGLDSILNKGPFDVPKQPVMGYGSWGSNDGTFNMEKYRQIRFVPGAIAETFVSTSGRTFNPTVGGQSLIADLIHQGVTGVKGYVAEPYAFALCEVDVLMDRYTGGFNLAESFYMSSVVVHWKDVVIGDPLCRPYKGGK